MILRFPKNFLWGTGVSSYQTEGNNDNSDWWQWEQQGKTVDKSGWATDSWHRYKIDHQLAADLGSGAYRISLEWARIEPKEGEFSSEALNHYEKVLKDIKARGMKRVVTLWHYTVPIWFQEKYNWDHSQAAELFCRYVEKVVGRLGAEMDIVLTMNEPRLPLFRGYLFGNRPPGRRSLRAFRKARKNMVKAHMNCYDIIKKYNRDISVGLTEFCNHIEYRGSLKFFEKIVEKIKHNINWYFFSKVGEKQDFIGINNYINVRVGLKYPFYEMLTTDNLKTDMGWGIYPEGMYRLVKEAWRKYKKPIYIMENGIADETDSKRKNFIKEHLKWLHQTIEDGADVRGYFYWSLLDNYEWEDGFAKRFGLCEVDYKTMQRSPRPSYYYYQEIIKENAVRI